MPIAELLAEKEDSKTEIETEPEYAELEQGESITSVENILNGKINDDTVIKHGDEVGKTIDDAELKDYTEEGNAVVEFEKSEEKQNTQINDDEQFIKNLEEFMGGDIAPYEPQWVDEISNEKHVRR